MRFPIALLACFGNRQGIWRGIVLALAIAVSSPFLLAALFDSTKEFAVGNHAVLRIFQVENGRVSTKEFKARTVTKVTSKEFEIVSRVNNRTVVVNSLNSSMKGWTAAPSGLEAELRWASDVPLLEIRVSYQADGRRPYIFKWLEITNREAQPVLIERVAVELLEVKDGSGPLRGGVGQPVLLKNEFFLGIEHPAAANLIQGQGITLAHYPYAELAPGATWNSKRAIFGATRGDESLEDAFREYLVDVTSRGPTYRPIYCDWAAHDELGTLLKPALTEQLTSSLLDQLESMKSKYGIQFAYYLMDAFWYDPKGAYLTFKKPNWPRGFESVHRRMLDIGMKPGLWFDIGGSTLDLKGTPNWHGPENPCLSDPVFVRLFENAFGMHIQDHSLGMGKFDFANLLCRHGNDDVPSLAILEKNADGLLEICRKARELNPAMVIRAYNGFNVNEMMTSTKYYDQTYAISPWWDMWFDSIYSGDPRPSELPSVTSLRDSVNWYQDHVFRGYARSLMPLFTIDDSGTLVGKTSTILYLGAENFTDSWILNIMRGNLAPAFYGDLSLLTERDREFMAGTLRFLREHQDVFASTRPILGIPGRGEVYGYLSNNEGAGLVTFVNPGLFPQSFSFLVPNERLSRGFEKLIFSNDGQAREPTRRSQGVLQGTMIPGEIRVYALGPRLLIETLSLPAAPTREYHEVAFIGDPFALERDAEIKISSNRVGMTLAVVIRFLKSGEPDRSFERPQEILRVVGTIGPRQISFSSIPKEGADIWSRCSWAVFKHRITANENDQVLKMKLVGELPSGTSRMITTLWLK